MMNHSVIYWVESNPTMLVVFLKGFVTHYPFWCRKGRRRRQAARKYHYIIKILTEKHAAHAIYMNKKDTRLLWSTKRESSDCDQETTDQSFGYKAQQCLTLEAVSAGLECSSRWIAIPKASGVVGDDFSAAACIKSYPLELSAKYRYHAEFLLVIIPALSVCCGKKMASWVWLFLSDDVDYGVKLWGNLWWSIRSNPLQLAIMVRFGIL